MAALVRASVVRTAELRYNPSTQVEGLFLRLVSHTYRGFMIEEKIKVACMRKEVFNKLLDYTGSCPTGLPLGKRWRCRYTDGWYVHEVIALKEPTRDSFGRPLHNGSPMGSAKSTDKIAVISNKLICIIGE